MNLLFHSLTELLLHPEKDGKDLVQQVISTDTVFCRSLVTEGYLFESHTL